MSFPEKDFFLMKRDSILNKNKFNDKNSGKSNKVIKYKIKQNYFVEDEFRMLLENDDFCENDILENHHIFLDNNNYKEIYYLYKELDLWKKFETSKRINYLKSK